MGFGQSADNSSSQKLALLRNINPCLGPELLLWCELSNGKRGIKLDLQVMGWGVGHGMDWSGSRWGQVTGSCECGNELSGSIKCGEFHD